MTCKIGSLRMEESVPGAEMERGEAAASSGWYCCCFQLLPPHLPLLSLLSLLTHHVPAVPTSVHKCRRIEGANSDSLAIVTTRTAPWSSGVGVGGGVL